MSEEIRKNLARAFAEESKSAVRDAAFALKAERDGFSELASLFRAIADAESVHARRYLLLMRGKIGDTKENLEAALNNEAYAAETAYPPMVEDARGGSKAVKKAFGQSMKTDGEHADLYREALEDMLKGMEREYYVCQICGHIHLGSVPDNCPVCKAVPGRFKRIS
jgi:rubrerythrin